MSEDLAYDNTYARNSSRYDSSPSWQSGGIFPLTRAVNPRDGSVRYDDSTNTLEIYNGVSWIAIAGGGAGLGTVTSVNGDGGPAVVLTMDEIGRPVTTKTANFTITAANSIVLANATGGNFTLTLPTAVGFTGKLDIIATTSNNSRLVTVHPVGSQTISGVSGDLTLGTTAAGAPYQTLSLVSDNSNWWIV